MKTLANNAGAVVNGKWQKQRAESISPDNTARNTSRNSSSSFLLSEKRTEGDGNKKNRSPQRESGESKGFTDAKKTILAVFLPVRK